MAQKFLTDIEVTQGLIDSSGDLGVAGQVLSSTGTETNWITNEANSTVVYLDEFTGDNSTVDFTISVSVTDENITQVYIDGVYQNKDTYSVSNTTLTFSTAPPLNADIEVITFSTATTSDDLAAGSVIIPVKNTHTASIAKGEPVYITGNVGSSARLEIAPADASNSAKMPAAGLLLQTLAVNAEGYVITGGYLRNITTDTIDGTSTTSNDTVYVKSGGGLTMTKPTGTNLIQNIAKVARSSGGSSGSLLVSSILRTNDVPNITNDYFWLGNSSGVATPTEFTSTARGLLSVGTEGTAAGDGNLAYNNSSGIFTYTPPVLGGLSGTTDNITEGSTNLYYTDARSRSAISVSGNAISYNSSTGVITSNYEENPTFTGNVTISGNLTVDGTQTILNTQTVEVEDNILQLNTTQGSPDTATATTSGISVYRGDGVTQASFIFDDADDTWDLTNNLVVDGNATINGFFTSQGIDDNANATAITINGSEEVGIGTLTPFYKLDVNGTFRASGNATFAGKILNTYTGTGFHELQNATSNGTVLRLSSTGDSRTLTLQTDHIYSNGNLYFGDNSYATYFRGSSYDFSTGNAHFSGNVTVGNDGDISMDSSANGQLMIDGNGYQGAIALDDTAMYVYHNSSGRNLVLGTNETARLTITASGNATFTGTLTASGYNDSNWNTAYGWGDHAGAGYITSFDITTQTDPKYLRSNAADTLSAAITLDNNGYFVGSPSHGLRFNNSGDTINALIVDNSGNSIAYASHRAPIFYDSNDTNYYVNPADTSQTRAISIMQGSGLNLYQSGNGSYAYQDARADGSYSAVHKGTNNGSGYGPYKERWYDGNSYHSIQISSDRWNFDSPITAATDIQAPIFYDSDNTAFYVDPSNGSNGVSANLQGRIQVGTFGSSQANTGEAWIGRASDRAAGILTVQLGTGTGRRFEVVDYNWTTVEFSADDSGVATAAGSFRAPIFYDTDNTGRYINPAGTSQTSSINMNNGSLTNVNTITINDPGYAEGITWNNGNGWQIYESSDANANSAGNLQFATGSTHRFRVDASGNTYSERHYDISNTAYYVDPDGLSVMNRLLLENARISSSQEWPVGHYTGGKEIWSIDPTWKDEQLQEYFGNSNVSWSAQADAPGGYAIYINGGVNVGGVYNSGFPYIPVEEGAIYYMECYIKNVGTGQTHYMGSNEFNESFTSLGGNPGAFGYWVMANTNAGNSWLKVNGIIRGNDANSVGFFENGTKYWTPMALFNYGAGSGTRACYISGWKVIKISANEYYADGTNSAPSIAFAEDKDSGMYRPGTNQLGLAVAGSRKLLVESDRVIIQNGFLESYNDVRSPIYYDRNNTGYYLDPASDSQLDQIHLSNYIRHLGDLNTYIGFPSNDNFVIHTNGSNRVEISNADTKLINNWFRASGTGTFGYGPGYGFHTIENGSSNEPICMFYHQVGTTAVQFYGINVISAAAHNNTTSRFFLGQGGSTERIKIYSNGNIQNSNNSYGQLSDINLKENIVDATPKLDDINQVRVVNFNYIGDVDEETNTPNKQIGVVAQELEEIFPGMVYECGDTETPTKSVKYSVFVPMLIKAVQELTQEVQTLKDQINGIN